MAARYTVTTFRFNGLTSVHGSYAHRRDALCAAYVSAIANANFTASSHGKASAVVTRMVDGRFVDIVRVTAKDGDVQDVERLNGSAPITGADRIAIENAVDAYRANLATAETYATRAAEAGMTECYRVADGETITRRLYEDDAALDCHRLNTGFQTEADFFPREPINERIICRENRDTFLVDVCALPGDTPSYDTHGYAIAYYVCDLIEEPFTDYLMRVTQHGVTDYAVRSHTGDVLCGGCAADRALFGDAEGLTVAFQATGEVGDVETVRCDHCHGVIYQGPDDDGSDDDDTAPAPYGEPCAVGSYEYNAAESDGSAPSIPQTYAEGYAFAEGYATRTRGELFETRAHWAGQLIADAVDGIEWSVKPATTAAVAGIVAGCDAIMDGIYQRPVSALAPPPVSGGSGAVPITKDRAAFVAGLQGPARHAIRHAETAPSAHKAMGGWRTNFWARYVIDGCRSRDAQRRMIRLLGDAPANQETRLRMHHLAYMERMTRVGLMHDALNAAAEAPPAAIEIERVTVKIRSDDDGDLSWLDQTDEHMGEGWEEHANQRKAAHARGEWWMVGVYAEADIVVAGTCQTVRSAGLWGIESDSGRDYFEQVGDEELAALADVLYGMGADPDAVADAIDTADRE